MRSRRPYARPFRRTGQRNDRDLAACKVLLVANAPVSSEQEINCRRLFAAFNKAPLLSLSQPLALAVMTVWPRSARASPRGAPWSKRMSIDRRGILRRSRHSEALGHKVKHCCDLLARHVQLFHHLFDAQIFKILDDCGNG